MWSTLCGTSALPSKITAAWSGPAATAKKKCVIVVRNSGGTSAGRACSAMQYTAYVDV